MKIIGVKRSTGVYQGNNFDNVNLFVTYPLVSEQGVGIKCECIKVKTSLFEKVLSEKGFKSYENVLNKEVSVFYDRFGRVCEVDFK